MASRVHLVRHGEVTNPGHVVYAALPGFGLSEAGVAEARAVARYLRTAPIVAVWSSPLERALATASPIAAAHDLPIRVEAEIVEWKMADDWAGIGWDDLPTERPDPYTNQPGNRASLLPGGCSARWVDDRQARAALVGRATPAATLRMP